MSDKPATEPRCLAAWEVEHVRGAVVAIDVIRAFTTSAYAFSRGARAIYLVADVDQALSLKAQNVGWLAMGEDRGQRPHGFDFSNSPVAISRADLTGRTLVQRTSAGTRGTIAARHADRLWCASLVNASATARALSSSGLGAPTYVITGHFRDRASSGEEDLAVAKFIERARTGAALDAEQTVREVAESDDAAHTLSLGPEHVDPEDIAYATRVDLFGFAMEVTRDAVGLRLSRVDVP